MPPKDAMQATKDERAKAYAANEKKKKEKQAADEKAAKDKANKKGGCCSIM